MPQTIDELKQRVKRTSDIFSTILNDQNGWTQLSEDKRTQLTTGVNKAYGQAMAFQHEYLTTRKGENKARTVITQTHADVTTGHADALFAKSSECKSVTKPDKGAVNKVIGDAIEQLGGTTGHNPRLEDVRIVDIQVSGPNNKWPAAGGEYGTDRPAEWLTEIERMAKVEITTIVNSNKPGATAVRAWLAGQTFANVQGTGRLRNVTTDVHHQFLPPQTVHPNPKSSRPVYQDAKSAIHKIRCLTIKIRYNPTYPITDQPPPNCLHGLLELVLQFYQKPNAVGLSLELAKRVVLVSDQWQAQSIRSIWS
ncbi:MAG TPA: hypothetical protein VGQ65_06420 [Thermoanaerobaculia bacterium]|jgi:hypothetical protein|nr:hypothetical protein [Thermoanaerobaculia bacterium]